jgi:hypothetical protein
VGSADVEHGETWHDDSTDLITIHDADGRCVIAIGNSVYNGVMHKRDGYSLQFNAHNHLDLESGESTDIEGQGPYTFVFNYDPVKRRLIDADGTVERYFEWVQDATAISTLPQTSSANFQMDGAKTDFEQNESMNIEATEIIINNIENNITGKATVVVLVASSRGMLTPVAKGTGIISDKTLNVKLSVSDDYDTLNTSDKSPEKGIYYIGLVPDMELIPPDETYLQIYGDYESAVFDRGIVKLDYRKFKL